MAEPSCANHWIFPWHLVAFSGYPLGNGAVPDLKLGAIIMKLIIYNDQKNIALVIRSYEPFITVKDHNITVQLVIMW